MGGRTVRSSWLFGFVAGAVILGSCGADNGEGIEEPNWNNPIHGVIVDSSGAADALVPFNVYVPKNLGAPSKIFVSPTDVPADEREVDFLYETADYGLVSVGEGPAVPPAPEWEEFITGMVASNPTSHGSAEIVTLDNGSRSLVTTSEDKTLSDICWLDASGTMEFCVLGPKLSRDDVVKIANSI